MTPIRIIKGSRPKTFSLGYKVSAGEFRDTRFAPALSWLEAEWLLENERRYQQFEAKFRGVKPKKEQA